MLPSPSYSVSCCCNWSTVICEDPRGLVFLFLFLRVPTFSLDPIYSSLLFVDAISWKKMRAVNIRVPFLLPCPLLSKMPILSFLPLNVPFSVPLIHWDHPLLGKGMNGSRLRFLENVLFLLISTLSSCFFPELLHFSRLRGRRFHTIRRARLLNFFCPSGPLGTLEIET